MGLIWVQPHECMRVQSLLKLRGVMWETLCVGRVDEGGGNIRFCHHHATFKGNQETKRSSRHHREPISLHRGGRFAPLLHSGSSVHRLHWQEVGTNKQVNSVPSTRTSLNLKLMGIWMMACTRGTHTWSCWLLEFSVVPEMSSSTTVTEKMVRRPVKQSKGQKHVCAPLLSKCFRTCGVAVHDLLGPMGRRDGQHPQPWPCFPSCLQAHRLGGWVMRFRRSQL